MANNPNSQFPANTNAPDGNYPYGSARNIAVPGDGTGTPLEEDIVNDSWGFQQKLLDAAGIVPSGNPETILASQYFTAMQACAGFPGLIVPMALNVDPAVAGIRVLLLDGSGILRANYPELDAAVYIGDSDNASADAFFRADNASGAGRNIIGNYLILADSRGRFLRGIGGIDPEGTRRVGDTQGDAMQNHVHKLQKNDSSLQYHEIEFAGLSKGSGRVLPSLFETGDTEDTAWAKAVYDNDKATPSDVTSETRPGNMAINYGVWY